MSMLNTSHLRGNVNSLSGIIECEFERRPPIYFPGEEVRGKIFFRALTAKFSISGLNSRLIGVEAVNFGNDFRGTTKAFLVLEYHALLTTSEDPEDCSYPFVFQIPLASLQSFSGPYGSIRYYVEAVLGGRKISPGTPMEENDLLKAEEYGSFFVLRPYLNLNLLPDLLGPIFLVKDNSGGLRSLLTRNKNPIRFTFSLHKKGFTPSEHIHFTVDIHNGSSKPITAKTVKLIQDMKFTLSSMKRVVSETVEKVVGGVVLPKTTTSWEDTLKVPPETLITTIGHCVSITYRLKVTLVTSGFSENVKGELGITIGTVPIDDFAFLQLPTHTRSNSFTTTQYSLSPPMRQRPTHHHAPFRSTSLDYRRSVSSLPSYKSVEKQDEEGFQSELPPPSYSEATKDQ